MLVKFMVRKALTDERALMDRSVRPIQRVKTVVVKTAKSCCAFFQLKLGLGNPAEVYIMSGVWIIHYKSEK